MRVRIDAHSRNARRASSRSARRVDHRDRGSRNVEPLRHYWPSNPCREADWMPRLTIVLEHGANRPFEPFDRQSQLRHNNGKSLPELLYEFRDLRHDSIAGVRETRILAGQFRNPIGTWGDHQPFPLFRAFGSDVRGGCIYVSNCSSTVLLQFHILGGTSREPFPRTTVLRRHIASVCRPRVRCDWNDPS
jgi:hypothetical protein